MVCSLSSSAWPRVGSPPGRRHPRHRWQLTYNLTFSGGGQTCVFDPSAVSITQLGWTFTGRIEIPDATCTPQGGAPYSLGSWGADIVNGTVNAAGAVTFDWGLTDTAHQTGNVSGNSMSGSMTGDSGSGSVLALGTPLANGWTHSGGDGERAGNANPFAGRLRPGTLAKHGALVGGSNPRGPWTAVSEAEELAAYNAILHDTEFFGLAASLPTS